MTTLALATAAAAVSYAQPQSFGHVPNLQSQAIDVSADFADLANTYFLADSLNSFNTANGTGTVKWDRYRLSPRQAFNLNGTWPVKLQMLDFPDPAYDNDPALKLQVRLISPRTVRVTMPLKSISAAADSQLPFVAACRVPQNPAASINNPISFFIIFLDP